MTTVKPLIVLALDTSTDMLACAVAESSGASSLPTR